MSEPRRVKIVALYAHISRSGRTRRGLIRRELRDMETGEVLLAMKNMAALRKNAEKKGWRLIRPGDPEYR